MGKAGRPPGKTYPHIVKVAVTDEMHDWVVRMAEVMEVTVPEAARVVIEGTMNNTKGKAKNNG